MDFSRNELFIEMGNKAANRYFRLPPGKYTKKSFCQTINTVFQKLPLIYDYYTVDYPEYVNDTNNKINKKLGIIDISENMKSIFDDVDNYDDEMDKTIVKFHNDYHLTDLKSENDIIQANQSIQALIRGSRNEQKIEKGLNIINKEPQKYQNCWKMFNNFRKSRIRLRYIAKDDTISVKFYGTQHIFGDYLFIRNPKLLKWLGIEGPVITQSDNCELKTIAEKELEKEWKLK